MGLGGKRPVVDDDLTLVQQREVECASEVAAKAEVERQEAAESDARAEWIYLRNGSGVWIARRVDRYFAAEPVSLKQAAKEEAGSLLNPLEWPWLFIP